MSLGQYLLESDQQLGNYQILRPLASGGMGEVYLANDTNLSRLTVIKIIKTELLSDKTTIERFYNEAKLMAKIESKNVASIFFFGELNGYPTIAMEYVNGREIEEITKTFVFPQAEAYKILLDLVQGLRDIHSHNIIHRDIKPGNIKLQENFAPKYLDFGIAKELGSSENNLTEVNYKMGTPMWMAPELRYGASETFQSDIWSLGCTAYTLLCGSHPLYGDYNEKGKVVDISPQSLANKNYHYLNELKTNYSEKFINIILKMMEMEPENRYKTCNEIESDLLAIKNEVGSTNNPSQLFLTQISNLTKVHAWLDTFKFNTYQKRFIVLQATQYQILNETQKVAANDKTVKLEQNTMPTKELNLVSLNKAKTDLEKLNTTGKLSMGQLIQKSNELLKTGKNKIDQHKPGSEAHNNIFTKLFRGATGSILKFGIFLFLLYLATAFTLTLSPFTRSMGVMALESLPFSDALIQVSDNLSHKIQNKYQTPNDNSSPSQ